MQSDLRFRPVGLRSGPFYALQDLPAGVARNQNLFKLRALSDLGSVSAVADIDFLWLGTTDRIVTFNDLERREVIDPYRLKAHAAYVQVRDFLVPGLDLRLGQQLVNWGKGDQFNPTNNLNANDFEDPLLFGQQQANAMLRADYSPQGTWSLAAVLVPIFRPAILPPTAGIALSNTRRIPIDNAPLRRRLTLQQRSVERATGLMTKVTSANPTLPPPSFDNMQFALRAAWNIGQQDAAMSYYYGRSDMPLPYKNTVTPAPQRLCDPRDGTRCINGLLQTDALLHYPRMQVVGLNLAGELPLLRAIKPAAAPFGYHVEMALVLPQRATLRLYNVAGANLPGGEYAYGLGGDIPELVDATPFAKWNIGLDYTVFSRVYLNVQWLHGFFDEFGAGDFLHPGTVPVDSLVTDDACDDPQRCVNELVRNRLGDYLVMGAESKFFADALLTRLFVVYDLTGISAQRYSARAGRRLTTRHGPLSRQGFSAIIFPEITYNVGGGLDLSLGALANLGLPTTKFGDPAVGGTEIWSRARYSY